MMKTRKTILTAISIILSFGISAQTIINNKDLLKKELDSTITANNLPLNSISVSPAGDWIVLFGDIGYSFIRTSSDIEEKLTKYNTEKTYLKDIDFFENAGWTLITKHNAYTGKNIPVHIKDQLAKINKKKLTIKCLEFNKSGAGLILYGYNSYYGKDLPASFNKKMKNLQYRNQRIKYASVNDDNSWVILYGDYGFSYFNIDPSAAEKLKSLSKQKKEINRVFLINEYWLITSGKSKIHTNL